MKLFSVVLFTFLATSFASLAEQQDDRSCYCKIKVGDSRTKNPIRSQHFRSLDKCQDHLVEKESLGLWENFCDESGRAYYEISCNGKKKAYHTLCEARTEYHQFLKFSANAKINYTPGAFSYHESSHFNLRRSFSDMALFIRDNNGLDLSHSLYGGIYDEINSYRVDLTLIDFVFQVLQKVKKADSSLYDQLVEIINDDPIKNFHSFFVALDKANKGRVHRAISRIVPILYGPNGEALFDDLGIITKARFTNSDYSQKIKRYNQVVFNPNKVDIFKELKSEFFRDLRTPITVEILNQLDQKEFEKLYRSVNWRNHIKRVNTIAALNPEIEYQFEMDYESGISLLVKGSGISREAKEVFNYLQVNLFGHLKRNDLTPKLIEDHLEQWEEVVQEHSWSRHITAGDDHTLLVLRDWMKKNQEDILNRINQVEMSNDIQSAINRWKKGRRPMRALTLDLYESLKTLYPDRPWEKHFILGDHGQRIVIGEKSLDRAARNIYGTLKKILSLENVSSAATSIAVGSATGNAYLSASATTIVHDFIVAKRYGYNVKDYMRSNTPKNLATSLIFSSGLTPGRTADAIFRGATNGAFQSLVTGQDVKLGFIVGGISGGALQQLPPEASHWIVPGENKNAFNIISELSEQAFFKGMNGALVGYFSDGNWQKGLRRGSIFGAVNAGVNILIFGVRYDANAFISDEEIAEYNHLHNHEDGHYQGEHLERNTSVMNDRYGQDIEVTRDDILRANIRRDGLIQKSRDSLATNFSGPFGSEISMGSEYLDREETILHEVMHTRQAQQGRLQFMFSKSVLPEGFWEEYADVGAATLPQGYYRTFIYVDLNKDLNLEKIN